MINDLAAFIFDPTVVFQAWGVGFRPSRWMTGVSLIQTLSKDQLDVAVDFFFHDMSPADIAKKRGSTPQAVEKLLGKAKEKLTRFGHALPERSRPSTRHIRNIDPGFMRSL